MLVVGTGDGQLRVVDTATGEELVSVPGHSEPARCVALSRDGSQIASGSWDRSWKLWDATTGEKIFSVQGHDGQGQCICRMDKSGYCTAVDPTCGKVGHSGTVNAIAFSPSGARLATAGSDCLVILWLANGHAVERLEGHSKTVNAVCFSGDRHLASGSDDKTIRVWDAFKGLILHTLSDAHARGVSALCFSPDGRQLASAGGDKLVKLWDVEAWDEEHVLEGHDDRALALAWSPNSQQLASGGDDRSVWVWDARAGRRLHSMRGHDGAGGRGRVQVRALRAAQRGVRAPGAPRGGALAELLGVRAHARVREPRRDV